MRNSEVYAYIERLYDAISSGITDSESLTEVTKVVMDFEEEVHKQMQAEEKQKSGFDSTPFFTDLAESTYDEIISIGERMDKVHPSLGAFMKYLMEEDDPTFFIAYKDEPKLIGRSSDRWAYDTANLICNHFIEGECTNDK